MESSISEVDCKSVFFLKFSVLENSRKVLLEVLEKSLNLHNLACMNPETVCKGYQPTTLGGKEYRIS